MGRVRSDISNRRIGGIQMTREQVIEMLEVARESFLCD